MEMLFGLAEESMLPQQSAVTAAAAGLCCESRMKLSFSWGW
jgi:hypothetical protein